MSDTPTQMVLTISGIGEDNPEELATATDQLRRELLEIDVNSVQQMSCEELPVGARVADPVTLGALIVAFGASGGVFTKLIDVLHDWLGRDEKRSVTLEIAGDKMTVSGTTEEESKRLVDDWITRHKSR
jgi:hypothetical protein